MLANSLINMRRLSSLPRMVGNENQSARNQPPAGRQDKYLCPQTGDEPMTLREIVDDLELQRFDALRDNAKRANQ